MYGWTGKILKINVSTSEIAVETPDNKLYHKYIGGRGLAGYFLSQDITREWYDPVTPICFFAGPLTATSAPSSGRLTIMSRSPLTGTIGYSSVGGAFGTELKKAGWDGIIITGKSDYLCGIEIVDGNVTIVNSSMLKGYKTIEVSESLSGKGAYAAIGPAAENGVLFSSIVVDKHFVAGRNGLGAVLGKKKIKYLTVKGTGKLLVNDLSDLTKANEDIYRLTSASPILQGEFGISNYGTGALYDLISSRRMMPTANFRKTYFESSSSMNAHAYKEKYNPKKFGCRGCHILCKKSTTKGDNIPEYETMSHFSALLENEDIACVVAANKLCNELGMDSITAAATIASYSEITGKKISSLAILELLEDIGLSRGIGKELGQGSYRYALSKGCMSTSMSVKKQELPAYDPRGAYGMALSYALSTRGGCHLSSYPISYEILRKPVLIDRFTFSAKAGVIKMSEDLNAIADSLIACKFLFFAVTLEEYSRVLRAVTAVDMSAQDLLNVGERIYYNERVMNAKLGFSKDEDDLPMRFFEENGTSGNNVEILALDRKEFLEARRKYYIVRGLNKDGQPLKEKALALGLEWND